MGIKGTIFVHHNPATRRVDVHAVNHGESPGTLTHNMRATEAEAYNRGGTPQHDDNNQFGHGNPVPRGLDQHPQVATMSFPIGGTYHSEDLTGHQRIPRSVSIQPGTFLRVGFRQRAFAVVPIPPPGGLVEIPYEAMESQANSAMLRSQWASNYRFSGWTPEPLTRDGTHVPPALQAILAQRSPHVVQGQVSIEPIADERSGDLVGWDVWFRNHAEGAPGPGETHGFTGTVVLTDRGGVGEKNGGLGLESMPCPGGGTAARQRIVAGGDYGGVFPLSAQPGVAVRLGIRGHSSGATTLPSLAEGPRTVDLSTLTRSFGATQSDWFDGDKLGPKLGEKKNRVEFFEGDQRINDRLPDTIYSGTEAFERAEFKEPPRILVERLGATEERPAGWQLTIENRLPDADLLGPVGFPCKPRIEVDGDLKGARFLAEKKLTPGRRQAEWFIPFEAPVGGEPVKKGTTLVIDTGPLGWRGTVALPGARETFDSTADPETLLSTWVLRESDYLRAGLIVDR